MFAHYLRCKFVLTFIEIIDFELKARTDFLNVWGKYTNHANPYIQGNTQGKRTTVPCCKMPHNIYML